MSTKIYTAYRLKEAVDLWDFAIETQRIARENCKQVLRELYALVEKHTEAHAEIRKELKLKEDSELGPPEYSWWLRRQHYKFLERGLQGPFYFEASLGLWRFEGRWYCIPYANGVLTNALDFLEKCDLLEAYGYWNNTDRPEEISDEEWEERKRVWDGIYEAGWSKNLIVDVCSYDSFHWVDPWIDLARELRKREEEAVPAKEGA